MLLSLKKAGYNFYTFEGWCTGKVTGKFVILRHDIDKLPLNALRIAIVEKELGIFSTYYFRISPQVFNPAIIQEISGMGHEVGYHYRDLVDVAGDSGKAIFSFMDNLSKLRQVAEIKTASMDGCPWSKFDNRDLWKTFNYREYGIVGEPYFDFLNRPGVTYLTDTGRMWDGDKYNIRDRAIGTGAENARPDVHSTFDLIRWFRSNPPQPEIMITTHPQRWTNNPFCWLVEFVAQAMKNEIKRFFI
ncbi:MAG TPA: hypothetical protein VK152_03790 [Paludibacter sp.]|nr:hypothetical protein [Paludibacter sp.]